MITFAVTVTSALGVWQLQRMQFKQRLQATMQSRLSLAPLTLEEFIKLPQTEWRYRRLQLIGQAQSSLPLLLSYQTPRKEVGYLYLSPVKTADQKKLFLVARAFIPWNKKDQPAVLETGHTETFIGIINMPPEPLHLGVWPQPPRQGPWLLPYLDYDQISKHLQQEVWPFMLQSEVPVLAAGWQRHLGYAIQWFCLSAVALVYAFIFLRKKSQLCSGE